MNTMSTVFIPFVAMMSGSLTPNHGVPIEESYALAGLSDHDGAREPRPLAPEPTPFTIEPGRLAIEADVVNYAYDRHNPDRTNERVDAFQWPILFRYGVTPDLEIQFGMDLFVREIVRDRDAGTTETASGFGDMVVGFKYNLWGNDEGPTAFSILPQLSLPTNRHGLTSRAVQGGVFLPYAVELPAEFEFEWTPGFSAIRNTDDDGYTFEWYSLAVLARPIVGDLEAFVEFESFVTAESGDPWIGIIHAGFIY